MDVRTPAARRTDPETSHEAAEEITLSGVRGAQQVVAAEAVRKHPGLTSNELAQATGLCRFMLARRLPEAEAGQVVTRGFVRRCSVSGRRAASWWPVPLQARLVA